MECTDLFPVSGRDERPSAASPLVLPNHLSDGDAVPLLTGARLLFPVTGCTLSCARENITEKKLRTA